jgi:uncharacterized membrane protein
MGGCADTCYVMYESSQGVDAAEVASHKRTLALAVMAPFGVLALMALPLVADALRQGLGF